MSLRLATLIGHAAASLRDPRRFARILAAVEMPEAGRWQAFALSVLLGAMLTHLNVYLAASGRGVPDEPMQAFVYVLVLRNPIAHALAQLAVTAGLAWAVFWLPRMFGGTGGFGTALLMVAWIEFVLSCIRGAQALAWFLSPTLSALIGFLGFAAFFWLLCNFVAVLHGFESAGRVLLGIVAAVVVLAMGLSFLLIAAGVGQVAYQ